MSVVACFWFFFLIVLRTLFSLSFMFVNMINVLANFLVIFLSQAEECFRESISIDPEFVPGLLLHGLICSNAEKYIEAEDFFEAAANVAPEDIVAHTMWGEEN